MLFFDLEKSWEDVLNEELKKDYVRDLREIIDRDCSLNKAVFPPKEMIFNAFFKTPYSDVKVVILGQDPYHGPNQAHGLSFSVQEGVSLPPSLKNIFKELKSDLGIDNEKRGCLNSWATQGVLLLNTTLTVNQGKPLSHQGIGWERFTDAVIESLLKRKDPVIFVLWGNFAQQKLQEILKYPIHFVLTAPHPSPFSARRGFFGCRHFSKINEILKSLGKDEIDWKIY